MTNDAATKVRTPSVASPTGKRARKVKLTRLEKAEQTRSDLFHAAAEVIGEHGYANAMILMITQKAKVANGTFYNYFDSRQELFDQLLPKLGREMLEFIAERSITGTNEFEREAQRFQGWFEYLEKHPEFYRILYEAEVFAPDAFEAHTTQVTKGYAGLLRKALNAGEISGYSSRELEVLANILMGARHYLAMRYRHQGGEDGPLPDWIVETYKKFIMGGLKAIANDD